MKRLFTIFSILILFAITTSASAVVVQMVANPNDGFKLEMYNGGDLVTWFAGSSCDQGKVSIRAVEPEEYKNRYWALILSAKLANRNIFIRYENTDPDCPIASYGMQ